MRCQNVLASVSCLLNYVYNLDKNPTISFDLKKWKYFYVSKDNQIEREYDSGLYVLMGFTNLIFDQPLIFPSSENSIAYRKLVFKIVVIIFYYSLTYFIY
jgi:hypothetical protein